MRIYCNNKSQLVQSVEDITRHSNPDLPLIMTISRGKSEDSYVIDATNSELGAVKGETFLFCAKYSNT